MNTITNLPPDPENQNDDRAVWANTAVNAFADITRMRTAGEDDRTILHDLLANLMHWCDRRDVDFDDVLADARDSYAEETEGQPDEDCAQGSHSWINETGLLPPDTRCTRCGERYGHPD